MIVLDTHTLLCWVNDSTTISRPALKVIDAAVVSKYVYVSSISSLGAVLVTKDDKLRNYNHIKTIC